MTDAFPIQQTSHNHPYYHIQSLSKLSEYDNAWIHQVGEDQEHDSNVKRRLERERELTRLTSVEASGSN